MDNNTLKIILKEYNIKREHAIQEAEEKKRIIFSSNEELKNIEDKINKTAILATKSILNKDLNCNLSDFEKQIENLKIKKFNLLKQLGTSQDELLPKFNCSICKDTGFVFSNGTNTLCNCLKQKLLDVAYNQSNISKSKNDTFENFDFNKYSDEVNEKIYGNNISPRKNIAIIKDIAINFIENFDDIKEKNLIFIGNTGLGKTYLSNCIANELLKNGKTVLYQTAPILLDMAVDYKFNKNNISYNMYKNIFDVDLLIIDDLGTESLNSIKFAELFTIINTRLLNQNNKITKTIISTNLSLKNLFETYDERIVSRLVGNYNICKFFGEDIRFKK